MERQYANRSFRPVRSNTQLGSRSSTSAHPLRPLQQSFGNQAVLRAMQSSLRLSSGPDKRKEEPKAPAKKDPDIELVFAGGRKEKADLTKIKGDLWWFGNEAPRLTAVGKYLPRLPLRTGLGSGKFKWSVTSGADKVK